VVQPGSWSSNLTVTMTNLYKLLAPSNSGAEAIFFRARRE